MQTLIFTDASASGHWGALLARGVQRALIGGRLGAPQNHTHDRERAAQLRANEAAREVLATRLKLGVNLNSADSLHWFTDNKDAAESSADFSSVGSAWEVRWCSRRRPELYAAHHMAQMVAQAEAGEVPAHLRRDERSGVWIYEAAGQWVSAHSAPIVLPQWTSIPRAHEVFQIINQLEDELLSSVSLPMDPLGLDGAAALSHQLRSLCRFRGEQWLAVLPESDHDIGVPYIPTPKETRLLVNWSVGRARALNPEELGELFRSSAAPRTLMPAEISERLRLSLQGALGQAPQEAPELPFTGRPREATAEDAAAALARLSCELQSGALSRVRSEALRSHHNRVALSLRSVMTGRSSLDVGLTEPVRSVLKAASEHAQHLYGLPGTPPVAPTAEPATPSAAAPSAAAPSGAAPSVGARIGPKISAAGPMVNAASLQVLRRQTSALQGAAQALRDFVRCSGIGTSVSAERPQRASKALAFYDMKLREELKKWPNMALLSAARTQLEGEHWATRTGKLQGKAAALRAAAACFDQVAWKWLLREAGDENWTEDAQDLLDVPPYELLMVLSAKLTVQWRGFSGDTSSWKPRPASQVWAALEADQQVRSAINKKGPASAAPPNLKLAAG